MSEANTTDQKIERTFRLTLRVKRAPYEFQEGMGVGVLATMDVTFKVPEDCSETMLGLSIDDYRKQLVRENLEVLTEELK